MTAGEVEETFESLREYISPRGGFVVEYVNVNEGLMRPCSLHYGVLDLLIHLPCSNTSGVVTLYK